MKNVARFDRGEVKGDAVLTDEGYIRANAIVTRTGIFKYQNPDGSIRRELRHPDDIWDAESITSMELIPITNGHPSERLVTAENSKRLAVGYTGESIKKNGDFLLTNMVITDHEAVNAIKNQNRRELSLGYLVDLEETPGEYKGDEYDARQRNIRYNHLAIVDKARAGSEARIALDSDDRVEYLTEVPEMAKRKIKIDNDEVMVEESTADYIDRLESDLKNLTEERARVEAEIKDIRDRLEKAEAERDGLKDQMSSSDMKEADIDRKVQAVSNMDSAEFKKAVNDRIKLYQLANENLDKDKISKLDSMSSIEIKKAIIGQCRKSINIDGKSDVYVEAMFDTIVDEQAKNQKVNCDNVVFNSGVNVDGSDQVAQARQRMIENQKNAHKKGA
jgi:uncharacterized protein